MAKRFNGGLIGALNTAKFSGVTTGMWTSNEITLNKLAGLWPFDDLTGVISFATSSSWIVPTGVNQVDYLVVAGGGGGGGGSTTASYIGGGGGGAGGGSSTGGAPNSIIPGSVGGGGSGSSITPGVGGGSAGTVATGGGGGASFAGGSGIVILKWT